MLIVYIALGAFAVGGGIVLANRIAPTKSRRYY